MEAEGHASFGHVLRRARRHAGLTQESLAERSGISVRAITDLERGVNRSPRRDTLEMLAEALELTPASRAEWERLRRYLAVRTASDDARSKLVNAASARRTNIPAPLDDLLGREADLSNVLSILTTSRLVTLTGTGGIGKTRLALATARAMLPEFEDGVLLVELAPIRDTALVLPTIGRVMDVQPSGDVPLIDIVHSYLGEKQILLVIDNLEQVIEAAPLITDLLEHAPRLKVLTTSRKRLNLRGERSYGVPPLAVPADGPATEPILRRSPAVQLFIERAAAVEREVEPTVDNLQTIARICRRLDGLPLAIELAAARSSALSLEAIEARLTRSLSFLTGGPRDIPVRQQTQRATVEWSYDLLGPVEQQLFHHLAVFAGGWTLDAAESVVNLSVAPDVDILDTMLMLVESHLITQRALPDGEIRFGMLETVRDFALERLSSSNEENNVRTRHARWTLALSESLEPSLDGADQLKAVDRYELEHDNLRQALDWLARTGHAELGLRLAGSLGPFWQFRGHLGEGRRQFDRLFALPTALVPSIVLAKALTSAGVLASWQEDDERAQTLLQAALAIWLDLPPDERRGAVTALSGLGRVAMRRGDLADSQERYKEMLDIARSLDDQRGVRFALHNLGMIAGERGDLEVAGELWNERLKLSEAAGDIAQMARTLNNFGVMYQALDKYDRARPYLLEAIAIQRRLGDKTRLMGTLKNLGVNEVHHGNFSAAYACFDEGLALARELGQQGEISHALIGLAEVARKIGDLSRALDLQREALLASRPIRHSREFSQSLEEFATLCIARGDAERAALLLAASESLLASIGSTRWPDGQEAFDRTLSLVRADLPDPVFAAVWEMGCHSPIDEVIERATSIEN